MKPRLGPACAMLPGAWEKDGKGGLLLRDSRAAL